MDPSRSYCKCRYDRFRTKPVSDFSGEENNWENWVILQKGHEWLGGGFKCFLFSPLLGEDSQFD